MMRFRSIRSRLRVALGAIAMVVFSVVGGALYFTLSSELAGTERAALHAKTEALRDYLEHIAPHDHLPPLRDQIERLILIDGSGLRVWIVSPDERVLLGAGPLPLAVEHAGPVLLMRDADNLALEGLQLPLRTEVVESGSKLLVALDTQRRAALLKTYLWVIMIACGSGVLLSVLLTDLATRQGLSPIRRISREAASVSLTSLSQHLDFGHVDREIEDLVRGLNVAAERVRSSYRQMESFNADVAHELRTPVACMISAAEVMLSEDRPPEALRDALADQLESLEQMKGMINDMLFLARADLGEAAPDGRHTQLAKEAESTVEFYEALLAESGIDVVIQGNALARCNPGLIRRAISNLLSNAIKHTARGETISIQIRPEGDAALIEVFNPGASMSEDVRARAFDRFYRADEARCSAGGTGLGLAIVRAVAMMHHGAAYAADDPRGTRVGLRIPREPPPAQTHAEPAAQVQPVGVSAGA